MADNKIYDPITGQYHEDYISDPNAILPDSYYGIEGGGTTVDGPAANNPFIQNMTIDEWQGHGGAIDEYGTPKPPWWDDVDSTIQDAYLKDKERFYEKNENNKLVYDDFGNLVKQQDMFGLVGTNPFHQVATSTYEMMPDSKPAMVPPQEMAHSNIDGLLGRAQKMGQTMPESFGGTNQNPTQEPNWNELRAQSQDSGGFMSKFGTGEGAIANFFRNRWKR